MIYIVTGKLGSGKSLYAVSFAFKNYLNKGRRVVANFPMEFSSLPQKNPRAFVEVIPDLPSAADLELLGRGGPNEREAGLLVIDEGARWLNSRDWSGQERQKIIDWALHCRKRGWDLMLIIQHHNMLDKQFREGLAEMHVICRRLDRVKVLGVKMPHIHVATMYYGLNTGANHPPKAESQMYKPAVFGKCYDTAGEFTDSRTTYCMLSKWHLVDRYKTPFPWRDLPVFAWKVFLLFILYFGATLRLWTFEIRSGRVVFSRCLGA